MKKTIIRLGTAALLLFAAILIPASGLWKAALFLIPYLLLGWKVLLEAGESVWKREPLNEDFLMAVATIGAFALGEYTEAVAVMLLFEIGELFEDSAVDRSREHIAALMDLRPDTARAVRADGSVETVCPDTVAVGTEILVQPGEKIPLDGVVLSGESVLDMAALTGESVPKIVRPGEDVCSGCVNLSGVLRIQTTKEFEESTASRILELVETAAERKAKSEKFISRFAAVYTPAVCLAALALVIVPPTVRLLLGTGADWGTWVYRALTFLVISCPCALVISIPLTFFAGIGGAGRQGVLVKGAAAMETLSKVRTAAFDKTGTLTEGIFTVTKTCSVACEEQALLYYASAAEQYSAHPVSRSLQSACDASGAEVTEVQEHSGRGVTAVVDGKSVAVGNEKLMRELGIEIEPCSEAGTVVYAALDGRFAGWILISDRLKPTAKEAVRSLRKLGVRKIVLLTGDSSAAGSSAAEALALDACRAELLPADKVSEVERLIAESAKGETVAFVGDGINDAPVLARADVGAAMGALGSDAAMEAADVVLMNDDPAKLAAAIGHARRCMRIVYENIALALGVKLICLLLGALGLAGMWAAVFADVGVMVLAVLNALRALNGKEFERK